MQNYIENICLHFFCFKQEKPFFDKSSQKKSKWFKWKFGTKNNLNMQNSMTMFTFLGFLLEIPFRVNLVKKKLSVRAKIFD